MPAYDLFSLAEKVDFESLNPLKYIPNPEYRKDFQSGSAEFRAVKDFAVDEEVYTYYTFEDSLKIYLKYGVVMKENSYDCIRIPITDNYYSAILNIASTY